MSTHYTLLGVARDAPADEIKRAFRREVARYHPDKVQHLGPEFQEIATTRSAALTEAYRTLMDEGLRRRYDEELSEGPVPPSVPSAVKPEPVTKPEVEGRASTRQRANDASTLELVKRAVLSKLSDAAGAVSGTKSAAPGFDVVYQIKGRKALFRRPEPSVRVAAKVVARVDPAAVEAAWPAAVQMPVRGETLCLMLFGAGLAPARDLAGSVSEMRRKTRGIAPMVIPVDIRDWQALMPPEAPAAVRSLLDRIRLGE